MALANASMMKFGLKIRTRSGLPVDNLVVQARDQAEAERKITQMYRCPYDTAPAPDRPDLGRP